MLIKKIKLLGIQTFNSLKYFNREKLCNGKMLLMSALKWEGSNNHKDIRGHYKNYLCAICTKVC